MAGRFYTIRNYSSEDFDNYLQLQVESEQLEPCGRPVSAKGLADYLGRPNFTPQKDLFIAKLNENLVGWLSLAAEPGIGRTLLDGLVHPLHRRKGIATDLLAGALQRVKNSGIMSAQVNISETNASTRGFLNRQGFTFIRYFFEMRLNIASTRLPATRQGPTISRRLKSGEEALLTELQNRCFGDSWGFNPNTTEEIAYRLNMHGRGPNDVTLAFLENKPVGYCWIIIDAEANLKRKKSKGLIHMMGVDPDYRQQEIGKAILLNGLRDLEDRGVDTVELTVDSENTAACSLYESAGFEVYAKTEWYERIVA